MRLNDQRFWQNILELSSITDPSKPYTRRSFSELFLQGRAWLANKMRDAGLSVHIDEAGNLIGRREGQTTSTLMIGSHSDTVPSGGRFDGIAGVLAGIEFAKTLQEQNIELTHSLEIIDFLAEEPSEWGISCIGSRGITGFLSDQQLTLTHSSTQETLFDAITRMGGRPTERRVRDNIAAFFELHIEQGIVLERTQTDVGLVSSIVGIIRVALQFQGNADHAGATPMNMRQDALVAAAETIQQAVSSAQNFANGEDYFVATCGQIFVSPNASNVIPSNVKLVFDIRSDNHLLMENYVETLRMIAKNAACNQGVALSDFTLLSDTHPTHCDRSLLQQLTQICQGQQISYQVMPSGAGHDAAFLSHIAPTVMLFVPSLGGKSHCPEEWTSQSQFAKGLNVLANTILNVDKLN